MRLLDQRAMDGLFAVARRRVDGKRELLRQLMWRGTPPSFENLDTPEKVRVFTRFLARNAQREQRGVVAGDLNQHTAANPAVQQMAVDAGPGMSTDAVPGMSGVPNG